MKKQFIKKTLVALAFSALLFNMTIPFGGNNSLLGLTKTVHAEVSDVNLAVNKPVLVTSTEYYSSPNGAVDGNYSTPWTASRMDDHPALRVDLGKICNISGFNILWEESLSYAKKYDISVSDDGKNWTTVYTDESCTGENKSISASTTGRYVLFYCNERGFRYSGGGYGVSIREFEVMGN